MNRFLTGLAFGAAAIAAVITLNLATPTIGDAKVFGHYTAVDNGDNCMTPQEIEGLRDAKFEKIASYEGEEADQFKKGVAKHYNLTDEQAAEMKWSLIDAYKFVAPDGKITVLITIYSKNDAGELCASGGGPAPIEEWDAIVEAAGMTPKASNLHPGHAPKIITFEHRGID